MGWFKKRKNDPSAKYTLRFESPQDMAESSLSWEEKCGPSPGGAADELGVSRQTVYNWINEGYLRLVHVGPEPPAVYITTHSIKRLKAVLDELRLEWNTESLKGCNVASELGKRLPQQDLFRDVKQQTKR
jgi:hypothetical protein